MFSRTSSSGSGERDFYAKREAAMADARSAYAASGGYAHLSGKNSRPAYSASTQPETGHSHQSAISSDNSTQTMAGYSENTGSRTAVNSSGSTRYGSAIKNLIEGIEFDDILIIGLFFLLFNENKEDDILILLILAVLLFT